MWGHGLVNGQCGHPGCGKVLMGTARTCLAHRGWFAWEADLPPGPKRQLELAVAFLRAYAAKGSARAAETLEAMNVTVAPGVASGPTPGSGKRARKARVSTPVNKRKPARSSQARKAGSGRAI